MLTVTGLVSGAYNLGSEWVIRLVVVFSLFAHVFLAIFAAIRRRKAYCAWTPFLWLAYQYLDWAAPYFLSNLSIGSTPLELQLVTLWLPCMVGYRAGPDNITAYSLEDIKTSVRLYVSGILHIWTICYVLAKQIVNASSKGALFWASALMVVVGIFKYYERISALSEANFSNIRLSLKKTKKRLNVHPLRPGKLLGNEEALLVAHEVLHISKGAFADFAVDMEKLKDNSSLREIFSVKYGNTGWKNMCKVVEMELSLMYDILYTKLGRIHKWFGYGIRVVSLVVTALVLVLFWLYNKDGQRTADVCITYTLLSVALFLDLRWLLGAAASTWTYAFFNANQACWLHHEVCCTGRWHRLRRFVVSLDPWQLLPLPEHGGGYRLWSGTIGKYNLFREFIHYGKNGRSHKVASMFKQDDAWKDYTYSSEGTKLYRSKNVKKLLFEQIQTVFNMTPPPPQKDAAPKKYPDPTKTEEAKQPQLPPEAELYRRRRELDKKMDFLPEFQEAILIWHVATDVFLLKTLDTHEERTEDHDEYAEAIKALSDYLAFLAAVRTDMLPGLHLRSLHQLTLEALHTLFNGGSNSTRPRDERQLVEMLQREEGRKDNGEHQLYDLSFILSDGIIFADLLNKALGSMDWKKTLDEALKERSDSMKRFLFIIPELEKQPSVPLKNMLDLLKLIFQSWVRMLIYVSTRCGRDSHAKQLGRGCELTTIVWILSEHTHIFAPKYTSDSTNNK